MLLFGSDVVGFNPGQLSGCQAWYDFTNSAYLTLVSTAITQALDRSGNGNNTAVQGTGTARPTFTSNQLNGLSTGTFDGGDSLILPAALYPIPNAANTMFVVAKRDTEGGSNMGLVALQQSAGNRYLLNLSSSAGRSTFKNDTGAGGSVSSGVNTNTNYQIFTTSFNGTTGISIQVNNSSALTATTGSAVSGIDSGGIGATLGGVTSPLIGGIAEILIYNRALTAAEVIQVNRYLSGKYAITIS